MVPFVKISLDLDEAHLGGLLLCVGLGALVVMPFCGGLVAKRGAKFLLRRALFPHSFHPFYHQLFNECFFNSYPAFFLWNGLWFYRCRHECARCGGRQAK